PTLPLSSTASNSPQNWKLPHSRSGGPNSSINSRCETFGLSLAFSSFSHISVSRTSSVLAQPQNRQPTKAILHHLATRPTHKVSSGCSLISSPLRRDTPVYSYSYTHGRSCESIHPAGANNGTAMLLGRDHFPIVYGFQL